MLTIGLITDLHFGPPATFEGKLRKLSHQAAELTTAFAERMASQDKPDLVVNLGDGVEDETEQRDVERYADCMQRLRGAGGELVNVAGNHDRINLQPGTLRRLWGMAEEGQLYRSFDRAGIHFVVLYTHERKDVDVSLGAEQLAWLEADLARATGPSVVLMHHSAAEQDLRGNRWFAGAPHICLVRERKALRALLSKADTLAVVNGHLHWNHLDIIDDIPYITLQSLVENVDDDAPGKPAAAHALMRISPRRVVFEVRGAQPTAYQIERPSR